MSIEALAAAVFASSAGLSLLWFITLWTGRPILASNPGQAISRKLTTTALRRLLLALISGVAAVFLTRILIVGVAVAAVVFLWPLIFGGRSATTRRITELEAIAVWTESLRDTCVSGVGLEQAIPATVHSAPEVIRPQLMRLAGALGVRIDLTTALRRFADDVDDEVCDVVVAGLLLNARLRGPRLAAMLGSLAAATRDELRMRQEVETELRGIRRDTRVIVVVILGFVAFQIVFADDWMEPYTTPLGQVVLSLFIAALIAAFVWMRRLAEPEKLDRLLSSDQAKAGAASAIGNR